MAYSEAADMLLGEIPPPTSAVADKYVNDAADEIDSKLGLRYVTPISIDAEPKNRASKLLLKRLNNWLASGRYVMAQSVTSELQQVHAYGAQLVRDATKALDAIVSGEYSLQGAQFLDTDDIGKSGPVIFNLDAESGVESFYGLTQRDPMTWPVDRVFPSGQIRNPYNW